LGVTVIVIVISNIVAIAIAVAIAISSVLCYFVFILVVSVTVPVAITWYHYVFETIISDFDGHPMQHALIIFVSSFSILSIGLQCTEVHL